MAEWTEALVRVSFDAALEAVRDIRDLGQQDPPTPGEVYAAARLIDDRIATQRRSFIHALPPPKPTPEEKARVRDLLSNLGVNIKTMGGEA